MTKKISINEWRKSQKIAKLKPRPAGLSVQEPEHFWHYYKLPPQMFLTGLLIGGIAGAVLSYIALGYVSWWPLLGALAGGIIFFLITRKITQKKMAREMRDLRKKKFLKAKTDLKKSNKNKYV